jgi:hypothetical protein
LVAIFGLGGRSVVQVRTVRVAPNSSSVLHVFREFLCVFHLIRFVGWFLVHKVHGRSVLGCRMVRDEVDGAWVHHGLICFSR